MDATGTRAYLEDVQLADVYGVYRSTGEQVPAPISAVYAGNGRLSALPACTADISAASVNQNNDMVPSFTYDRFGPDDPSDLVLAPSPTNSNQSIRVSTGYSTTSVAIVSSYDGSVLQIVNPRTGARSEQSFRYVGWWWGGVAFTMHQSFHTPSPYVDMRTGELMAESMRKTIYRRQANGTVTGTAAEVLDTDRPGCYRSGEDQVVTISVGSYRCSSGACLKLAPRYTPLTGGSNKQ